tara:strand:+ start:233 stop:739 length:507 start_codon:yes stop_codon:yes gene_type:complete
MKFKKEKQEGYAERPNKSAEKRIYQKTFSLIERAAKLNNNELEKLGFDQNEILEISSIRSIKSLSAKKRQLKFCVKNLSKKDLGPLEIYIENKQNQSLKFNQLDKKLQINCDNLIEFGDKELSNLIKIFPNIDRQQARTLIRNAKNKSEEKSRLGRQRLLAYLKKIMQ